MRLRRFLQFGRSKTGHLHPPASAPTEDLDAFLSESGSHAKVTTAPQKQPRRFSRVTPFVAALAIIEAVPAGLWLHQTFAISEARAADSLPSVIPPAVVMAAPCEAPPPPVDAAPAVASQGTARARAAATAGTTKPSAVPPPRSVGGLVSVVAPVPMRIYSRGRIVGTTEAETIMLPVGNHDLDFVSDEAGYKARRTVNVQAGRTSTVRLEAPTGTVHINAAPWAEVWIDNHRVGDTPMGNLRVPIGVREFVFRHPELGERRKTALVTLKEPLRISMNLRSK